MKKGFTLVELLAVILILAILVLVIVPTILNVIETSRKSTAESSVLGYVKAVEKNYIESIGTENAFIDNETYTTSELTDRLDTSGNRPTDGLVYVTENGVVGPSSFCMNGYYIAYDGTKAKVDTSKNCDDIGNENATVSTCFLYRKANDQITISSYYSYVDNDTTKEPCPKDVVIPSRIEKLPVTVIGTNAFREDRIQNIQIPNTVTKIGTRALYMNSLVHLEIPSSVTEIGEMAISVNQLPPEEAFLYKRNQDGSEDRSTLIGYGGALRENIVIPSQVTVIDNYAFALNSVRSVQIPNTVTKLGNEAFYWCSLTTIIIPDSVTEIGNNAFAQNQLTSVELGNKVVKIGSSAFIRNKLSQVIIPASVQEIGVSAFKSNQLTKVQIKGKTQPSDFKTYGNTIWGWASGYSDANIEWNL